MHPLTNIALRAGRSAAAILAKSFDRLDRVQIISDDSTGLITSMDQEVDAVILEQLRKAYPNHGIHSRVSGEHPGREGEPLWMVDAIIGNRNFMAGYPVFGVSIGCQVSGRISHGVVLNVLSQDEYVATRGTGAQLNGRRIRVSSATDLKGGLLGLDSNDLPVELFTAFQGALLAVGASPRISGCSQLDMVQVASAQFQGGWCANIPAESLAPARLILTEAGGFVGSEAGSPDIDTAAELIFGNPKIFKELVRARSKL